MQRLKARKILCRGSAYKNIKRSPEGHQQRTIITLFRHVTPSHPTSELRTTKVDSQPRHSKGVTIDQAIAMCHAHRSQLSGPQLQHPCYQKIKPIITQHQRCFPHFRDLSILEWPMLENFQRQKFHSI